MRAISQVGPGCEWMWTEVHFARAPAKTAVDEKQKTGRENRNRSREYNGEERKVDMNVKEQRKDNTESLMLCQKGSGVRHRSMQIILMQNMYVRCE